MTDPIDRAVMQALHPERTITITRTPQGKVSVSYPLGEKPLCYQLLIQAAVMIADYPEEETAPKIIVPTIVPPKNIRPA